MTEQSKGYGCGLLWCCVSRVCVKNVFLLEEEATGAESGAGGGPMDLGAVSLESEFGGVSGVTKLELVDDRGNGRLRELFGDWFAPNRKDVLVPWSELISDESGLDLEEALEMAPVEESGQFVSVESLWLWCLRSWSRSWILSSSKAILSMLSEK